MIPLAAWPSAATFSTNPAEHLVFLISKDGQSLQSSSSVEGSPDHFANLHSGLDEDMLVPSVVAAVALELPGQQPVEHQAAVAVEAMIGRQGH